MSRASLLAAASLALPGCLVATDDLSDGRSSSASTAAADRLRPDASASAPDPVAAPVAHDWEGDVGPSHPELFVAMSGQREVGPCSSSACVDFVQLNADCVYGLQVHDVRYEATIPDADCAALKRWYTSDVLLAGLRSPCGGFNGFEALSVEAADPAYSAGKKFDGCEEEPFPSHRACLAAVRARYFPGR